MSFTDLPVRSRLALLIAGAAVSLMLAPVAAQTPDARALALYNAAVRERDPKRQIELFRESLRALETFEGTVALGDALLRNGGDPLESRRLCSRAFSTLVNPDAPLAKRMQATALVCLARSYRATGERGTATRILKRSLELQRVPAAEAELADLVDGHFKPAATIADELNSASTPARGSGGVPRGAVPMAASTDVYVNFEFDKAALTPDGERQVAELARALDIVGKGVARGRFRVIGHTDARGTDAYNLDLSRRRAQTVADVLVSRYRLRPADLVVEGRGKRELLFTGDTEDMHARNRRVEVQLAQ